MIKKLRYLCTLLLIAVASAAWGAEEVYKTLSFPDDNSANNGLTSNQYQSTWTAKSGTDEWSISNFNNNNWNNNWTYIKCGSKNEASVATITTATAIDKAITKVVVTIDAITANSVNSIKLYTSSDNSTWNEAGSFSKAKGAQEVTLASPAANLYYKVEFDCAKGSSNGLVTVSKVEYYYNLSDKCALPTFSPVAGTYTSAQNVTISTTTGDATIYYTTDGTDPTEGSASYSTPISVSSTTTIKAIAVKSGLTNSSIATATYTIVAIENEGTEENPYTVSDARNAIDANTGLTDVYAKGFVKEIPYAYTTNNGITFNMVDEEDDEVFLQAYKCTGTDANNVKVGDIVVVKGNLTKYNSTYEFAQGCELVSLEHPQSPTITLTPEAINLGSSNPIGSEISKTFTVSQINLTADIALSISGQGAVSPTTIGKGAGDTEVTWIYTPTEVGNISATITATSGGAETQTLTISGSAVAPLTGDCYEQVTEDQQDWSGCYIITGTNSGNYYALTGVSNKLGSTAAVTVVGDKIESNTTTDAYQVIVAKTENGYSLYMDGVGYLYYSGSNNNLFASDTFTASSCEWTFSISDNLVTLTNVGSDTRKLQFNYNSGNPRFACYTSNQVKLTLFKFTGTVVQNPSIIAADVEIAYDAISGSISYTLENEVQGGTIKASVTSGDWLTLGTVGETIPFTCEANTADARTATVTLTYTYGDNQTITKEVRVTQTANPNVSDCAELPFAWDGGASADFLALDGVSAKGLGTDYAAQNHAPYLIKLDETGDYIQVNTDSQPGKVTIGVKMIGGANASTITVQESADGEAFTDVQELTISGAQNDVLSLETTNAFAAESRYVRLLFTKGSNVGVGPITIAKPATEIVTVETVEIDATATSGEFAYSIAYPQTGVAPTAAADVDWISDVDVASDKVTFTTTVNTGAERSGHITLTYGTLTTKVVTVTQAAAPQKYTLTIGTPENVTITATYNSDQVISNGGSAELENGTEVTFALTIPEGYTLESLTVAGPEEGQTVTPTESATTAGVYTFNMPAFNVTINASVTKVETITYTLATSITPGKHYIITNGTDKAMGEQRTNNRGSGDISISDETAIVVSNAGVHEFVIDGNAADGYTIKEEGVGYLYAASTTKNWLMTQETNNDNGIWTISIDSESGVASIKAEKSENRNVMQYNVNSGNPIFSCYASASQSPVYLFEKETGDVNNDGHVDIADVTALVNILLDEVNRPTQEQIAAGDLSGNGGLSAEDVKLLVEKVLTEE